MTASIEHRGEIAVVTVDNPPVNALSQAVRQALLDAAEALDADPSVKAVVLACAGRTFIAGADVSEFGKPPEPPHLPDVVARIERAEKPWVAAIHGSALGGGFEVALGCRFRVAAPSARVGLPEARLGIVPGAGGTVRLPRLAGVETAVGMITTGTPLGARKAADAGLIDAVIEDDFVAGAVSFVRAALGRPLPEALRDRPVASPVEGFWDTAAKTVADRAKREDAPLKARRRRPPFATCSSRNGPRRARPSLPASRRFQPTRRP
jgi:3-hydroxyacyl-CoA dehydrogenase